MKKITVLKRKAEIIYGTFKLLAASLAVKLFFGALYKKNIWLICEKSTEARDNGYWFFRYLREKHPEINAYYAIVQGAADSEKVKKLGNVIEYNSFRHYMYYAAALVSINSQPFGAAPQYEEYLHRLKGLRRKKQITVFLQHGIIKDELSHVFDYENTGFDIFTTSSSKETEFIRKTYGYPAKNAPLLGLCRYDNLHNIENRVKKQVLIMPTFRRWLKPANTTAEATESEKRAFVKSDYYAEYSELLSDGRLLSLLQKNGYKVVFYPHYSLQSYIECFRHLENETVVIADRNGYDVQQLLIESEIMITDFSSVFFDFAYMKKPEIFFQFDEEKFREGHYKKGYFDYRENGFGPVAANRAEVIRELEKIMEDGGKPSEFYMNRINSFFDINDDKNCERTYRAITELL